MPHWEHFSHGSDIGIRGKGSSLHEAFEMVAVALSALVGNPGKIFERNFVEIKIKSEGLDFLLYDWINRLIYEMATRHMLFSAFKVEVDIQHFALMAQISGEPIDIHRHEPGVEVKGATFTELKVEYRNAEWLCQCIVDV